MRALSPTQVLTLFWTLVGFVSGCGLAQYGISGYRSIGPFAGAFLLSLSTFVWFRADSFQRSIRRSPALNVAFVGLTVFVLPYYLIKSRGVGAGLRAIGVSLAIYVVYASAIGMGMFFVKIVRV